MEELRDNLVEMTENVETTTEEIAVEETPIKTYTQEELDSIVGKRLARREAKIRKEYDRKYGELENVLKAGTGKNDVEEMTRTFTEFYESKGVQIPKQPSYSDNDIRVLAQAEADEIIKAGFEDVIEEVDRLSDVGLSNMTPREREVFRTLAEYRKEKEVGHTLSKIGVKEDVYSSKEFKDFAGKFSPTTPITEVYDLYTKTQPRKEIKTMGSMKNNTSNDSGVKDFYTRDEALRFTKKDFDKNPALYKAVQQSMIKW